MGAYGNFGGTPSQGVLTLFSNALGDAAPHFLIKNHTALSVWYYHNQTAASKNIMIDAQLYNNRTRTFSTLGDFLVTDQNGNNKFVVDQNNRRLHAAYRTADPLNSWLHAVFDLDVVYNNDPDKWFVMAIYVRFDNTYSGAAGRAITFFDDIRFTYAAAKSQSFFATGFYNSPGNIGRLILVTTTEAWGRSRNEFIPSTWNLGLKVSITGWVNSSIQESTVRYPAFPYNFSVSVPVVPYQVTLSSNASGWTPATGINLTSLDLTTRGTLCDFFQSPAYFIGKTAAQIIALAYSPVASAAVGWIASTPQLACAFAKLLAPAQPSSQPVSLQYKWPLADLSYMTTFLSGSQPWAAANAAHSEAWISATQVTAVSVPVDASVKFVYTKAGSFYDAVPGQSQVVRNSLQFSPTADSNPLPNSYSLSLGMSASPTSLDFTESFSYTQSQSVIVTLTLSSSLSDVRISPATLIQIGQTPYLSLAFYPNKYPTVSTTGSTSVTLTWTLPAGTVIRTTRTYTVPIYAVSGASASIPFSTIIITVRQNCFCITE